MGTRLDALMNRLRETGTMRGVERLDYTGDLSTMDLLAEAYAVGKYRTEHFDIDKDMKFAYTNIARWLVGDKEMECINPETKKPEPGDLRKGIYLAGRTGCGKSWAMEIFGFLAKEHRMLVCLGGKELQVAPIAWRADAISQFFMTTGELAPFMDTPVLLIDDLGTEPAEVLYMGNRVDVLRYVLERRADDAAKLTLITSNVPMFAPAIKERYGDRVASRLRQMCNYMEISGNDKRVR